MHATLAPVVPVSETDTHSRRERQGYNLLHLRPVGAFIRWWGFPYVFQSALLAFFVVMAVFAWGLYPPEGVNDKLFAKSNFVNLLVWFLWWPAMVWTAVLFGRVWCAVCPLELVADAAERLARTLGVEQRVLGKWLRSGALIVALYGLIQMLVAGVHLHRIPAYTSWFLWGLLTTAALAGFLFKDRAFCRGFCPVGLLLGTYGRGAMLAMRSASKEHCSDCTGKDCVRACNRSKLDARSCPSLLNPARVNNNADCLVCGQCVKVCQPENMGLFLRRPFDPADAREPLASWPVMLFVMLVSGFVTSELCSELSAAKHVLLWIPEKITASLGPSSLGGWVEGIWTLFVVPSIMWSALGTLVVKAGGATNLGEACRRLALPMAVVLSAGHMSKGLAKLTSAIGFVPLAIRDPVGVETARALAAKTVAQPASLLPMPAVSVAAVALMLTATYFALREFRLAQGGAPRCYRLSLLLVASPFLLVVFGWGFL